MILQNLLKKIYYIIDECLKKLIIHLVFLYNQVRKLQIVILEVLLIMINMNKNIDDQL